MLKKLLVVLVASSLVGCGSSGDPVPSGETYGGQLVAALMPVTGSGIYRGEGLRLQRQMAASIDATGVFAGVLTPGSPTDGHEGEVVIEPRVVERSTGDRGRITLALYARRKTTGQVDLDRVYKGRCGRCSGDPSGGALDDAMKAINRDLKRRYREPAIY